MAENLKSLSVEALQEELVSAEKHYQSLKFSNAVSTLGNTSEIKIARRRIARIHTELRAREIAEQEKAGTLPKRDKIVARRRREKKA